jgi:CRISPR-associated exonuclease Cas4
MMRGPMPYAEDDPLPLSALQHLLFCERQCALIHVERVWTENRFTAEGRVLHRKAHEGKPETRDGVRITRGLPLCSFDLGLARRADVVLWERRELKGESGVSSVESDKEPSLALQVAGGGATLAQQLRAAGPVELKHWTIAPVEYKRGRPKTNDCDRVQLCAQAICMEEMLGIAVRRGQLFYGKNRRRFDVEFDADLRETTKRAAARLHELVRSGTTPPAVREKKCDACSLLPICLPEILGPRRSVQRTFDRQLAEPLSAE